MNSQDSNRFSPDLSAADLRAAAAANRRRREESFDRCDTDGFLSQWASDITARLLDRRADLVEAGGRSTFTGLYDVSDPASPRRVAAREVLGASFYGHQRYSWLLREDEAERYGRKYVPTGERSRVQRALGLAERSETDAAWAIIGGGGRGLSGCASASVVVVRDRDRADQWGGTAELDDDGEEN